jgi:hypothetical protein
MGDPAFESTGFGLAATEDEGVEARLVDGGKGLEAARSGDGAEALLVVVEAAYGLVGIWQAQDCAEVSRYKPSHSAVISDYPELATFVSEGCQGGDLLVLPPGKRQLIGIVNDLGLKHSWRQ